MSKNRDRSQSDLTPEEQFPNQPRGAAGQPMNRPAEEGHQSVTPIQPDEQDTEVGVSPTEAVTHGEPSRVVDTAYTGHGKTHVGEHAKTEDRPERSEVHHGQERKGHKGKP